MHPMNNSHSEPTVNSLSPRTPDSLDVAASWAVRLDDAAPLSRAEQQQLQDWLDADPEHVQLLQRARQTWSALAFAPAAKVKPVHTPQPERHRHRRSLRRSLAVAALVVLGVLSIEPAYQASIPWRADHSSAVGEVLTAQLPDGSQVSLDSGSAIQLDYGAQRHVRLLRGQAIFDVAPMTGSEDRPFVVSSQGVQTRALGTRFVVSQQQRSEPGWVGVQEHAVSLSSTVDSLVLNSGESADFYQDGRLSRRQRDLHRATSWQRGVLIFERAPLAQVISELNRYHKGHILLRPGSLTQREVSGVFRLDNLGAALVALETELGIQRRSLGNLTLLY